MLKQEVQKINYFHLVDKLSSIIDDFGRLIRRQKLLIFSIFIPISPGHKKFTPLNA